MRYAHKGYRESRLVSATIQLKYADGAGHPTGVCADALRMGGGYTAAIVRLVCRIACKITCKINLYLSSLDPVRSSEQYGTLSEQPLRRPVIAVHDNGTRN